MTELTPELTRVLIERLFAVHDREKAAELLDSYGTAAHEREPIRVRIAALKLCEGKLDKLERAIGHAKRDYRDVLAWAEYPGEMAMPTWRMPDDEVKRIRGADKAQYLAWLAEHAT
jgi:hypothetical protein